MAAFEEHCNDCERLLGDRCEDANRWMDAMFAKFGANHRFLRHHWRGVAEAEKEFGAIGRKAAIVHILKDCGKVPRAADWEPKADVGIILVPADGLMGHWDSQEQFDDAAHKLVRI